MTTAVSLGDELVVRIGGVNPQIPRICCEVIEVHGVPGVSGYRLEKMLCISRVLRNAERSTCDHGWIPGGSVKVRQSINQ